MEGIFLWMILYMLYGYISLGFYENLELGSNGCIGIIGEQFMIEVVCGIQFIMLDRIVYRCYQRS